MAPLWGTTDKVTNKPKFLTDDQNAPDNMKKQECVGLDDDEIDFDDSVAQHAGWTVPAGGNDNTDAQRETLACVTFTGGDIDPYGPIYSSSSSSSSS